MKSETAEKENARSSGHKSANILVLFHNIDRNNGGTASMLDLMDDMRRYEDIRWFALFPKEGGTAQAYLESEGIPCKYIPFKRWDLDTNYSLKKKIRQLRRLFFPYNLKQAKRMKSFLADNQINLIYTNTCVVGFGCILSRMYHIPHIWHIREFGWEDHQMKCIFGRKCFIRCLNDYTDQIIVVSKALYYKYAPEIKRPEKICAVYDDISGSYYMDKTSGQFDREMISMLIAGTLQEGKGQQEAIEALKIVLERGYHARLYIAGDGPAAYIEKLKGQIRADRLEDAVFLLGQVDDLKALRADMQIGLVCSRIEAFGRVTVESMLGGMLVIGAGAGGTTEIIEDGVNGFLYRAGEAEDLAQKVIFALDHRAMMKKLAADGQRYARETFCSGCCGKTIYGHIRELSGR